MEESNSDETLKENEPVKIMLENKPIKIMLEYEKDKENKNIDPFQSLADAKIESTEMIVKFLCSFIFICALIPFTYFIINGMVLKQLIKDVDLNLIILIGELIALISIINRLLNWIFNRKKTY